MKKAIITMTLAIILPGITSADIYSPIAHWEFNETSGTIANDSANNNDGVLMNSPVWSTGNLNGALELDGWDDYIEVPIPHDLKMSLPITICTWIKQYSRDYTQFIILTDDDYPDSYVGVTFGIAANGTLGGGYHDGGPPAAYSRRSCHGSVSLDIDTWYHVVYVIRGETDMEFYINAVEDTGCTFSGSGDDLAYTADGSAYIGTGGNPENLFGAEGAKFHGLIDDIRIYDYALDATEVYQLYQIPEPATIGLLSIGTLAMLRRKR